MPPSAENVGQASGKERIVPLDSFASAVARDYLARVLAPILLVSHLVRRTLFFLIVAVFG